MTENQFRWRTLTAEVSDKASPLRQHLDARFPNLRPLQNEYKASAGGILVERGSAHPGTLGAAFDFAVRFALDPGYKADIAVIGFMFDGFQDLVGEVVTVAKAAQTFSPRTPELMRACWALALCTEVLRVGLMPGSPLAQLVEENRLTAAALLDLATQDVIDELTEISEVAEESLLRHILDKKPLKLGPTFVGSKQCPADADLIAGGTLIDIKCTVGKKNSAGARYIALDRDVIYQLVAYALFDYDNAHAIDSIGLYSARYGHFFQWPLQDALSTLADRTASLDDERHRMQELLLRWA
ncbi:hypothetical protein OG984_02645 [Nocardioides sp. NBC_00368]|uniref:hypothetical protein n=1 Tax=Nocardioides sp. NBC_00368 TaxID=2976000 RepID=UPI002E24A0CB